VLETGLGREEGRIDVLVSNAGIQIIKPGIDLPFADWEALVGDPSRLSIQIALGQSFALTRCHHYFRC
jgi:NAD(P)-dependent dehydrogenase (short-subunit alcohol dehydrogenase family)